MADNIANDFLSTIDFGSLDKKTIKSGNSVMNFSIYVRHLFTDLLKPYIDDYGKKFGTPIPNSTYYKLPDGTFFLKELETTQSLYIDITNLQREISAIPEFSKPILRRQASGLQLDDDKSKEIAKESLNRICEYEIVSIWFLSGLAPTANLAGALKMVLNAVRIIAEKYDIVEAISLCDERLMQIGGLHQEPNASGSLRKSKEFLEKLLKDVENSPEFTDFVTSDDDKYDLKWNAIFTDKLKKEKPDYYAKHTQYNKLKKQALKDGKTEEDAIRYAKAELKKWIEDPKGYQKAMDRLEAHNAKKADVDNSDDE